MACRLHFIILPAALLLAAPSVRAQGGEPSGIWQNRRETPGCVSANAPRNLRGHRRATRADRSRHRQAASDDKNPNPALKKRPIIGLPLFSGMHPTGPGKWSGTIYNADDGSSYEQRFGPGTG
jgi:hypothetical protein